MCDFRLDGLNGANTHQGPTYKGGWFFGGGPARDRSLVVRTLTPMGEPASVELDLCDNSDGCTVSLDPDKADQVAAALIAGATKCREERAKWQQVLDRRRDEWNELALRDAAARAGEPEGKP